MIDAGDRLNIAKSYPYSVPRRSYLFVDGVQRPPSPAPGAGRTPVIACGSNRSPAQLARKFRSWPQGTEIPVTLARLADHDVVYSAHFSRYGAMPATLLPAPGVRAEVAITWLTAPQLERMHQTEGAENYRFVRLDGIDLETADGSRLAVAHVYWSRRGALRHNGAAVPLAAIDAAGRDVAPLDQEAALTLARDRLAPDAPLDDFILQNIACPVTRAQRTARLRRDAILIDIPAG